MFITKIRELRLEKDLSQEEVANGIGVGKNTYLAYEKGTQSPKLETVQKIALFYGVPMFELVCEEEADIDETLRSKLQMIKNLGQKEKESLLIIMESLFMRNQNLAIHKEFKK
ncbi:helix-turn-helix domain-containing protein [Acinetobacter venetianus]|uniref:helix-turn-helix domain-containing protein n=1 Tax=Acinetobacter venetianus TaxID=52133 RepID=UPI003A8C92E0